MGNVMHRGKGSFTHVENTVFFDRSLSLKAKGIYCQIRSLESNPEWVFTIRGFASLVRDGVDAVTAGIKELEGAGYIIRARKRSENGRFLKAEEATWITLDDPAMHGAVSEELKADGFAVLSEFSRSDDKPAGAASGADPHGGRDGEGVPEKAQVVPRTGKPVSGAATSGEATSGKPISGESAPINYSKDGKTDPDEQPPSCPPEAAGKAEETGGFRPYRRGEFPEAFERLCAMSLKPVTSLRFKRDCHEAWRRKVASGFLPDQIADAYAAYSRSYWLRNGDDRRLAKNLLRWIEGEDGLAAWADEPVPPDLLGCDGEPLDMPGLAKADPEFAPLWRKVESRRSIVRSLLYDERPGASEEDVAERCAGDRLYGKYMAACEERYGRYLAICELLHGGGRRDAAPADGRRAAS